LNGGTLCVVFVLIFGPPRLSSENLILLINCSLNVNVLAVDYPGSIQKCRNSKCRKIQNLQNTLSNFRDFKF
jgi:hypothetical protein